MHDLTFLLLFLFLIVVSYIFILVSVIRSATRTKILIKNQTNMLRELSTLKLGLLNKSEEPTPKTEATVKEKITEEMPVVKACPKEIPTVKAALQSPVIEGPKPTTPPQTFVKENSPAIPKEPGKIKQVFIDIKDWLLVGDKYRSVGVSKEYAIASNWLARLGIMILVLGIAFALRYSYVHGLVSHQIRVIASLITGILMTIFGLKQNGKKYELLGHGLLGAGITTLYFSVFSATNLYHLIAPTLGIGCMVLVTIACGVLSVKFNSKLVAILGILGGYLTPILLSTGSQNLGGLYSYMLLIGLGVLGITIYRNWYLVRALGFVCHWLIVTITLTVSYVEGTYHSFGLIMALMISFFLLFSFNACFYQIRKQIHSTILEIVGLFLNSAIFTIIATGLVIDHFKDYRYGAAVMLGLAIFYIGCSNVILRRKNSDRGLVLTFLAFSGFYTAMALPFLLSAGWLTVSWSLQALIMLWLSRKLNNRFLQTISYIVYVITFVSLISTFQNLYQTRIGGGVTIPIQDLLRTTLSHLLQIGIPVVSFFLAKKMITADIKSSPLATDATNDMPEKLFLSKNLVTLILQASFVVFVFLFSIIEVGRFFQNTYAPMLIPAINAVVVCLAVYFLIQVRKTAHPLILTLLNLLLGLLVLKILFFDSISGWNLSEHLVYGSNYYLEDGLMRLLNFGMLTAILVFLIKLPNLKGSAFAIISNFFSFVTLATPLIFLTLEVKSIMNTMVPAFQVGAVSLVWAIYAVTMLAFGVIKSQKSLRYLALILFAITTLKVFIIDLEHLGEFWRIIAFIALGIIIFFGSFIYIRYQHLFSTIQENTTDEN